MKICIGRRAIARVAKSFLSRLPIVFCFLTAAPALLLAGQSIAATIPPAPIGLDANGTSFAILSNASSAWRVSADGGQTFGSVKNILLIRGAVSGAISAADRQPFSYIWAPTCTTAAQTLLFRRTYFLMGIPKTLAAELYDTTYQPSPANQAISSAKIFVNGTLAFSARGAYIRYQSAVRTQAKLFVFGKNTIDVVVTKRAQQGSYGHCKNNFNPPTPLGILISIRGDYEADLWLSKDSSTTTEFYERIATDGNYHRLFVVGGSPRNLGRSGIYKGKMTVDISGGDMLVERTATITGQGLRNCVVTKPSSYSAHMDCDIFEMSAGATARATFRVVSQFDYKFSTVYVFSTASANSVTSDPHLNTNGWRRIYYFCSTTATDPKCPAS